MKTNHNIQRLTMVLMLILCCTVCSARKATTKGYIPVSYNGQIYYETYGKGEPLFLLHGHTLDRRMWDGQIADFSKRYKVIVVDFRGYGLSSKQSKDIKTTHLDDLITVMDSLRIPKAHIVGLSMGGFIAGDMVGMHPERMLSCVMCSGALRQRHPSVNDPMDSTEIASQQEEIERIRIKGVENWRKEWIEKLIVNGGSKSENIRKPLTEIIMDWDCYQITNIETHLYYGHEAMENLIKTRPEVPTMYLSGETEHKKKMGLLDYLPNSTQTELPDCGHMSNMEQPELFNKTILNFLQSIK